jgi:hypothetical protein
MLAQHPTLLPQLQNVNAYVPKGVVVRCGLTKAEKAWVDCDVFESVKGSVFEKIYKPYIGVGDADMKVPNRRNIASTLANWRYLRSMAIAVIVKMKKDLHSATDFLRRF